MKMEEAILDIQKINDVYWHLGDELSKYIYSNRLLYSITGDMKYIRNVVCTNNIGKEIYRKLLEYGGGVFRFSVVEL